jgi:hypothetical protein
MKLGKPHSQHSSVTKCLLSRPVRLTDKPWLKVLLADFVVREKYCTMADKPG